MKYGVIHNPNGTDDEQWCEWFDSLDEASANAREHLECGHMLVLVQVLSNPEVQEKKA